MGTSQEEINSLVTTKHRPDRRLNIRYRVRGSLVLVTAGARYEARPLHLSFGCISFRAKRLPPVDTQGILHLAIDGFDEAIWARVRLIRANRTVGAAIFLVPQSSLARCISWLASQDREESD